METGRTCPALTLRDRGPSALGWLVHLATRGELVARERRASLRPENADRSSRALVAGQRGACRGARRQRSLACARAGLAEFDAAAINVPNPRDSLVIVRNASARYIELAP